MSAAYQKFKKSFKKDWHKLPNVLTLIRLVGSIIPGSMYLFGPTTDDFRIFTTIVFVVLASTDMFDGLTARIFNLKTDCGKFLDPIADLFFGLLTIVAISVKNPTMWFLVALLVVRQLHILYMFYWADENSVPIGIVISGKAKTAAIIFATIILLLPASLLNQQIIYWTIAAAYFFTVVSWIEYSYKYSNI